MADSATELREALGVLQERGLLGRLRKLNIAGSAVSDTANVSLELAPPEPAGDHGDEPRARETNPLTLLGGR